MTLHEIGRPLHAHGVRTPGEYRERQRIHLAELRRARPAIVWGEPHDAIVQPLPFVSGGRWVVQCPCGNAPSADPGWRLACCFECGAIYADLAFPLEIAWIEALLLARPAQQNRHWFPHESVADLARENTEHGIRAVRVT